MYLAATVCSVQVSISATALKFEGCGKYDVTCLYSHLHPRGHTQTHLTKLASNWYCADGRVVAWNLPDGSTAEGIAQLPTQRMIINAHSRSAVSALLTTPWGALWTAGRGGSLRWFPTAMREASEATGALADIVTCMIRGASNSFRWTSKYYSNET